MSRRLLILFGGLVAALVAAIVGLGYFYSQNSKHRDDLQDLFDYRAPTLALDTVVLRSGETESRALRQRPVKLPDGHLEHNKAIVVRRGTWVDDRFVEDARGRWFKITLLVEGDSDAEVSGLLHRTGYGLAASCWKPSDGGDVAISAERNFNCIFRTNLTRDGSIRVLWTMLHPEDAGLGRGSGH